MIVPPLLHLRRKVTAAAGAMCLALGALTVSANSEAACTYTVTNEWSNGFNATVTITNTTNTAINGWSVDWQYSGNNRATSAWSADLSGNNPYTAANLSWNGVVQPNQFVQFGVQGTKQAGAAEIPTLSGSVCVETNQGPADSVYIQVDKADDHIFLYVDGVEKMRWSTPKPAQTNDGAAPARIGEKINITHLLAAGENEIRIVAAADNWYSLFGGYDVRLWQGDNLLLDAGEDFDLGNINFAGTLFSESVTVQVENAGPRRTLTLNSANGGEAIYLNGVFTGKHVPATFELASGEYRIGLGESTSVPDWANNTAVFTGQFREQDIVISGENITLDAEQLPILDTPNEWKVAVVPYTEVHFGLTNAQANAGISAAANDIGILTSDDIEVAAAAVRATSDEWLLPLSYGLMKWDVTVLPAVTQRVYHTDSFRWSTAMINADLSQYDMVIHLIANRTTNVDGNGVRMQVVNNIGGLGERPYTYMPQSWLNAEGNTLAERLQNVQPSSGMLHESLHTYDNYRLNDYNGVEQVHGAETHGYSQQDCGFPSEWLCWYRGYIRSQIGENTSILSRIHSQEKITGQNVATYIGNFNVMRGGRSAEQLWSYKKPVSRIRNNGTQSCLSVAAGEVVDGAEILPSSCNNDLHQQWSLHVVQNSGAYHVVNQNSRKCADVAFGGLLQQTCAAHLAQRFILGSSDNGRFPIKTLSGQCLAQSVNNELVLENCSETAPNQRWYFD
jgi:Cellobiohydrolase A (1,4-beta-cellobiosidase A)